MCSPSDAEEQAWGLGTGCAVRINSNLGLEDGVHLEGIAINKILGSRDRLIWEGAVRELSIRAVVPGKELADMENWVDTGHGGWEGKLDSYWRDDG